MVFIPRDFKAELEEYLKTLDRDLAVAEAQAEGYRKERSRVGSLLAAFAAAERAGDEPSSPVGGPTRQQLRVMFPPGSHEMGTKALAQKVYGAVDAKAVKTLLSHLDALDVTVHDSKRVALKDTPAANRMMAERYLSPPAPKPPKPPASGPTREQVLSLFPPGDTEMTAAAFMERVRGLGYAPESAYDLRRHLDTLGVTVHDSARVSLKVPPPPAASPSPVNLEETILSFFGGIGPSEMTFSMLYPLLPKSRGGYAKAVCVVRSLVRRGALKSSTGDRVSPDSLLSLPKDPEKGPVKSPKKAGPPDPRVMAALRTLRDAPFNAMPPRSLSDAVYGPGKIKDGLKLISRLVRKGYAVRAQGLDTPKRVLATLAGLAYVAGRGRP